MSGAMETDEKISSPSPMAPPLVPPFLSKCYEMVSDPSTDEAIAWSESGNSFVIVDPHAVSRDLLHKFFKHNNLSSFIRQLNTYGFRKVNPDRLEFAREGFFRGQKHLLKTIIRKRPSRIQVPPPETPSENGTSNACIEVGKFGVEEEIERLKRDKDLLREELVKLRKHQQSTESQVSELRHRLRKMEQSQQQMLSFFAKAFLSPGFLAQLVQNNSGNRKQITGVGKKRHLTSMQDEADHTKDDFQGSSEGQIVRYNPPIAQNMNQFLVSASISDVPENPNIRLNGNLEVDTASATNGNNGELLLIGANVTNVQTIPDALKIPETGLNGVDHLSVDVGDLSLGAVDSPVPPVDVDVQQDLVSWYMEQLLASPGHCKDVPMDLAPAIENLDVDNGNFSLDQLELLESWNFFDDEDEQ